MNPRGLRFVGAAYALLALVSPSAFGESAADFLPATTVAYAEVARPGELVDALRRHSAWKSLESLPEYEAMIAQNPAAHQLRSGLLLFEIVAQRKWHEAIGDVAGEGLSIAFDVPTQGAVLMARAPDEAKLRVLLDRLLQAARADARQKGNPEPFEELEYRGHKAYKTDQAIVGAIGRWLIIANKADLARAVADNLLDGGKEVLGADADFRASLATRESEPAVWAYLDNRALREAGVAEDLYDGATEDPGAELLVGGIAAALAHSRATTASLFLEEDRLRLVTQLAHEPEAISEDREFYFGKNGRGAAPPMLAPQEMLLAVTSYRDVGEMWRRRSDLFDEETNAGLAQADTNFSSLFAGMDFGREVLGALDPRVQIISAPQDFARRTGRVPKIKLPAVAMVFQLKEPEKMRRQLTVSFQSIIGLTNIGSAQNELPQLELQTENSDGAQLISATYDYLADETEVSNDIIYNFSPSLAFVGDHFILSSTRELARELMTLSEERVDSEGVETERGAPRVVNTRMVVDSQVLRELVEANRESLIAQNMLENGHARDKAEQEIGGLIALLKLLGEASLELSTAGDKLQLEVSVALAK